MTLRTVKLSSLKTAAGVTPPRRRTLARLAFAAAVTSIPFFTASAQSPKPVTFSGAKLFSGDGVGDRIPGADGVPAVALGDFNGDGIQDLVTTSYCFTGDTACSGFSLLLGNGDGTFQSPTVIGLTKQGQNPVGIAVGDFNGDGKLDLAFRAYGPDEVYVLLGNGSGGFTGSGVYPVGAGTNQSSIAAADVNGDGFIDLIVTNTSADTVSVLLGNGDGTFQPQATYSSTCPSPYPSFPRGLAIGDINGDGKPDLITTSDRTSLGDGISVLLNNGNGFQAPQCFGFGVSSGSARTVAIADFNLDGKLDVVMGSWSGATVFVGNGDGTFQMGVNYAAPFGMAIGIGDFNGDNNPDVVIANWRDSIAWVLIGNGDGTLAPAVGYQTDWSADNPLPSIAVADLNGDGFLDFVAGDGQAQMVTALLGNGDGTFRGARDYLYIGGHAYGLAAADFTGNGNVGVVLGDGSQGAIVMPGNGDGTLGAPVSISFGAGRYAWSVAAADISGDGITDIVATPNGGQQVAVVIGSGGSTFQPPVYYPTGDNSQPYSAVLADVNADGAPDIITSNGNGSVSVLLNQGQGVFGTGQVTAAVTPSAANMIAADFNGDGKLDLALANGTNLTLVLGNGDGTFRPPQTIATPVKTNAGLAGGDFNHDGKFDLAVASVDNNGSLVVLLGNGDGTFTAGPTLTFNGFQGNARPWNMTVSDLNLDGNPDLVISLGTPHVSDCGAFRCAEQYLGLMIFLGQGDGTFVQNAAASFPVGPYGSSVAAGDFNGDGLPDVALINDEGDMNTSYVSVAINSTSRTSPTTTRRP